MDEEICFPCDEPVSPIFEYSRNLKRKRLEGEEDPPGTVENPLYEVPKEQRVEGLFYWTNCRKHISMWNGKRYVCEHGRRRSGCKECGGSQICEHGRERSKCKECVTVDKMQESKRWCSICCNKMIGGNRLRAGIRICAECDATVPDRIEVQLRPKLVELVGFEPSALDDTLFGTDPKMCDVVKRRRPDFLWQYKRVVICVECDEKGGHSDLNYTPECDGGWMTDMTVALTELHQRQFGKAPYIFFLRFNPDERHRKQTRVDLDQRLKVVADRVNEIRALKDFKGLRRGVPMVEYYYYHSKCTQMISYTRDRPDAFRVLKVVD